MYEMATTRRDYQLEQHLTRVSLATVSRPVDRMDSLDTIDDRRMSHSSMNSLATFSTIGNVEREEDLRKSSIPKQSFFERYHWRMTHYFYIHLMIFIFNGLFIGLIVWLIENYSSVRNLLMDVPYLDAWFTTVSCICGAGLTTIDFAKLSRASQIVLMCISFLSSFAISTLPALLIKTRTHRTTQDLNVDDDNDDRLSQYYRNSRNRNIREDEDLPADLREQLRVLPTPTELRYRAYVTCIILIISIYGFVYVTGFLIIGVWLDNHRTAEYLSQNNETLNPWYVACILTLFSFNQNGLTPFSTNLARYVDDIYLNIVIITLILCGSSFFPLLLRNIVLLSRRLAPWRHKVIFDYLILNNHHLSTLIFPSLQTRIYVVVSILLYTMGIGISLILDMNISALAMYSPGIRFMIFFFQTVNLRFCGFQSIDISALSTATLLVYILLMITKPQMLCALDESPFEIYWLTLETQAEVDAQTKKDLKALPQSLSPEQGHRMSVVSTASADALIFRRMRYFLRRQSLATKELARQEFSRTIDDSKSGLKHSQRLNHLRVRLFLIHFVNALLKHTFTYFILTRTWLFVFIFLICAFEYQKMNPIDPNITLLKVVFEIISAFGGVGMSLGYPNLVTSFATVLTPASKIILILTMLMGRHRGLLASMKDQEVIEYSAANILVRHRDEYILQYRIKRNMNEDATSQEQFADSKITFF